MTTHDDDSNNQGEESDGENTDSIAGGILRDHCADLRKICGHFEQIALVLHAVSPSTRRGLLDDAEDIARRVGNCGHDLARLLADLKRSDGG